MLKLQHANVADLIYVQRRWWMENDEETDDAKWTALRALRQFAKQYVFHNIPDDGDAKEFYERTIRDTSEVDE